ncbi:hypothetical protein PVAP13_4NG249311 [Panicum virgatum]|uniref:RING-type domain-containing protein n=1 Tax=Panicum virgatum TaxID=38727 RepID=A0A8T0TE95_PANVG|nr:hypothetical protein PVAP13_4NG249311 [Panicum virgatum]
MGGVETRSEEDLNDSGIVRALGSGWRWKFSVVLLCALTATLLLICLAKPCSAPRSRCARCAGTTSSRGRAGSRCPGCGHPYHRGCIALAVDHDPRCPVCRAPVSPGDIHSPR